MTRRQVAERLGVTKQRVQAMERQGQLTPEARVTEYGVTYLWFDPQQVEALALARAERAAGQRPRGVAGPAPKPPRVDE